MAWLHLHCNGATNHLSHRSVGRFFACKKQSETVVWARSEDTGSGGKAPPFLTSTMDEGEWPASCPCRITPGERAPGTQLIVWVGPRAGLDAVKKLNILPCRESNQGPPARSSTDS
jgi:hypothetical protein